MTKNIFVHSLLLVKIEFDNGKPLGKYTEIVSVYSNDTDVDHVFASYFSFFFQLNIISLFLFFLL